MPSEQKTISIDPDLFVRTDKSKTSSGKPSSTRETLKRERKVKPRMPKGPSSNTLRKNLLARIKEHQMREQKDFQKSDKETIGPTKGSGAAVSNEFDDEFSQSLAYLTELAKATQLQKHEKKHKHRNSLTLKTSSMRNVKSRNANGPSHINASAPPEVSLEMPSDLAQPMYEVKVLPSNPVAPTAAQQNDHKINLPPAMTKDVPYGVLRGGNKPTFREYTKKLTQQTTPTKAPLTIHDYEKPQIQSVREQLLNEMKAKRQDAVKPKMIIPKSKQKRTKTIKRTTTKRKFKLGKDGKKRVISVLIKNNSTRRQVKLELGKLKTVPIKDVRHYLKRHGLLKVGSVAPPDVLRHIYEQSILSGDIHNTAKETLIHNFLNDKDPSW